MVERPSPETTRQTVVPGAALAARRDTLGQPHGIAIERRHHRAAGRRIDVADDARAVGRRAAVTAAAAAWPRRVAVFRRIGAAARRVPATRRPASRPQRFSSPSSTCQKSLSPGLPGSKKCASRPRISGMLAASNQMMRWSLSLMWPCQHIGGVRIRSPAFMSQRRPLTMVAAPSARVAKRIAAPVWRCGRAWSPGSSTVKAASSVLVVVGVRPRTPDAP